MNETKLAMGVQLGHFDGYIPMIKFYNDSDCENELISIAISPSMLITLQKQIEHLQEFMLKSFNKENEDE